MAEPVTERTPEFPYTDADFRQIKGLIYDDAGIYLPDTKKNLVYSRLARRLRALNIESFDLYCDLVQSRAGRKERANLINALTTNLTHFFREPHHFELLRKHCVPEAKKAMATGGRYRLWSAGCSTGEEPYSMAIALLDEAPELADHDVRILATDIDSNVVDRAKKGAYTEDIVAPVEPRLRQRFFETGWGPQSDKLVVGDELRAMVAFKTLNLMQPWPMAQRFDVIMCRNVVIYFDEPTKAVLWDRFCDLLNPGGWLFIGHSERVQGKARERLEPSGLTAYRRII